MSTQRPNPDRGKAGNAHGSEFKTLVQAESLLQIAFVLPAAVLIGWGAGALLDKWLHTHWIYIVGLLFGSAAGLVEVVRQAMRAGIEKKK
ncbi:MAG TPA: AtpZ/AtpI family protein [Silvibacterium sp.]|nr:AtpZ/AtpI family protein [Silvibacterium sp.]